MFLLRHHQNNKVCKNWRVWIVSAVISHGWHLFQIYSTAVMYTSHWLSSTTATVLHKAQWWFSVFISCTSIMLTWYGWRVEWSDRKSNCWSNKNSTAVTDDNKLFPTTGLNACTHKTHNMVSKTVSRKHHQTSVEQLLSMSALIQTSHHNQFTVNTLWNSSILQ